MKWKSLFAVVLCMAIVLMSLPASVLAYSPNFPPGSFPPPGFDVNLTDDTDPASVVIYDVVFENDVNGDPIITGLDQLSEVVKGKSRLYFENAQPGDRFVIDLRIINRARNGNTPATIRTALQCRLPAPPSLDKFFIGFEYNVFVADSMDDLRENRDFDQYHRVDNHLEKNKVTYYAPRDIKDVDKKLSVYGAVNGGEPLTMATMNDQDAITYNADIFGQNYSIGNPGKFVDLKELKYGQEVFVRIWMHFRGSLDSRGADFEGPFDPTKLDDPGDEQSYSQSQNAWMDQTANIQWYLQGECLTEPETPPSDPPTNPPTFTADYLVRFVTDTGVILAERPFRGYAIGSSVSYRYNPATDTFPDWNFTGTYRPSSRIERLAYEVLPKGDAFLMDGTDHGLEKNIITLVYAQGDTGYIVRFVDEDLNPIQADRRMPGSVRAGESLTYEYNALMDAVQGYTYLRSIPADGTIELKASMDENVILLVYRVLPEEEVNPTEGPLAPPTGDIDVEPNRPPTENPMTGGFDLFSLFFVGLGLAVLGFLYQAGARRKEKKAVETKPEEK